MTNSIVPDQLALLVWIYTVCKGRAWPGSAGQELNNIMNKPVANATGYCSFFTQNGQLQNNNKKMFTDSYI